MCGILIIQFLNYFSTLTVLRLTITNFHQEQTIRELFVSANNKTKGTVSVYVPQLVTRPITHFLYTNNRSSHKTNRTASVYGCHSWPQDQSTALVHTDMSTSQTPERLHVDISSKQIQTTVQPVYTDMNASYKAN